ncbi:MAG: hypothetical protein IJ393_02575 [Clostridia bacterium]|nr:hypothetical protein [Clostridia bacterium]
MQYLVQVGIGEERAKRFLWLEKHGYKNIQRLSEEYPYSVIIVEERRFFGGNVTCFAASKTKGKRFISWTEWLTVNGEV